MKACWIATVPVIKISFGTECHRVNAVWVRTWLSDGNGEPVGGRCDCDRRSELH